MNNLNPTIVFGLLLFVGSAAAVSNSQGHQRNDHSPKQDLFEYAQVVDGRHLPLSLQALPYRNAI